MRKLNYASCEARQTAKCILFAANTLCAGSAPTVEEIKNRTEHFSADVIRQVDNVLYSLPENFKLGDQLWDDGNLKIEKHDKQHEIDIVQSHLESILIHQQIPICLGGDHLIKYAAIAALNKHLPGEFGVIYLDAHPDCEENESISYSSILHHGFLLPHFKPEQVMLIGLRQFTEKEARAIQKYNGKIGIITGTDFIAQSLDYLLNKILNHFKGKKYLYFSIDLDGLDPASAPAVESPYPGGPLVQQILYFIQQLAKHYQYIGMDISEFIPALDNYHISALSAARLFKEFYSMVASDI